MAKACEICGKTYLKGNLVPRGIGRRVTNRAIRKQKPNLRSKKIELEGRSYTVTMCASCLKRLKFNAKKKAQDSIREQSQTTL